MFVCGGLSTFFSVWLGLGKGGGEADHEAGRHFWNASRFAPVPCAPLPPPKPPLPPLPLRPSVTPSFCRQACIFAKSCALGRGRFPVIVCVFACVFSVATIFGTMPS